MYDSFFYILGDVIVLGLKVCYKCKKVGYFVCDCIVMDVEFCVVYEDRVIFLMIMFELEKIGIFKINCKVYFELRVVFVE